MDSDFNAENKRRRNVHEHFIIGSQTFWRQVWKYSQNNRFPLFSKQSASASGSFLIAGANDKKRTRILCSAIWQFKRRFPHIPIIILNDSEELEDELIYLKENNKIDGLVFSNPLNPNYEPLLGMCPEKITDLIFEIAQIRGATDCSHLSAYTQAVLSTLTLHCDVLSLTSINQFLSTFDGKEIYSLAKGNLSSDQVDVLYNQLGSSQLRDTIHYMMSVYHESSISNSDYHISICRTVRTSSNIHCIRVSSEADLHPLCLTYELNAALKTGDNFLIIVNLCSFSSNFAKFIEKVMSRPHCMVGVSLSGTTASWKSFENLPPFRYRMIFTHDLTHSVLEKLLNDYGTYEHKTVEQLPFVTATDGETSAYSSCKSNLPTKVVSDSRPRVSTTDTLRRPIILSGHRKKNKIEIVRYVRSYIVFPWKHCGLAIIGFLRRVKHSIAHIIQNISNKEAL